MIDAQSFKQRLLTQKQDLEKDLAYLKNEDPYLIEDRTNTNTLDDDITETEGHDRITATRLQLKQGLAEVNAALKRLEDGTFGKCLVGGEEISPDRLAAMPTASVCLDHSKKR